MQDVEQTMFLDWVIKTEASKEENDINLLTCLCSMFFFVFSLWALCLS